MAFATGSRHELSFIAETVFGTTPGTPAMSRLRNTGTTLNVNKETFQSGEIRADRQITDERHGTRRVAGDVTFELSYGAFDSFLESALFGTWATNILKAGVTQKSFTMERRFLDVAQYLKFTGCVVNTMSLDIQPSRMVTGSFGIIGKDGTLSGTSLGVPTDVNTSAPFDAFTGAITEGGAAIASVTALSLSLDNQIEPTFVIGSAVTPQLVYGRSNLTGRVSAFFENATMFNKFINETESAIQVTLDGVAGDLVILVPRVKYTGGEIAMNGERGIMLNMPFQALLDGTTGTNLQLTRVP